jgi:8-oxo-dGTP pyrophosphatase MutT (NUDIX family)
MRYLKTYNESLEDKKLTCGIYLFDANNLLLIQHPTNFRPTVWGVPKGRPDVGEENLFEVAKRELFEETGIVLDDYTIVRQEEFNEVRYNDTNKYLKGFFVKIEEDLSDFNLYCDSMVYRNGKPSFPEVDEYKWVTIEEAKEIFSSDRMTNFQLNNLDKCEELLLVNESFDTILSRESKTRTKSISEEELLEIIRDNCKNFSFDNDPLWRNSNTSFGKLGLFSEKERFGTIGNYNYKDFFDLRKEYPVPRYKSLIGSTSKEGAERFGSNSDVYMVIPFDNSQIVFAGSPDLALWSRTKERFRDELFTMKEYTKGFQVPSEELTNIRNTSSLGSWVNVIKDFGFEFFTTSPCLLIHESKIDWLRNNISDLHEPNFIKESKSNSELVLDIKDILADLKDDGYYTEVSMNPGGVSMLSVEVYKSLENLFNWLEIEDNFDVVKGYVEENSNWSLTNVYISYYKLNSEMDKILTGREHNWTSKMFTKKFKSYDKFLSFVKSTGFTNKNKLSEVSLIFDVRN